MRLIVKILLNNQMNYQCFQITRPVAQLLGLSGLLPQHPDTYITAWRNRQAMSNEDMRRDNVVLRDSSSDNSSDKLAAES